MTINLSMNIIIGGLFQHSNKATYTLDPKGYELQEQE